MIRAALVFLFVLVVLAVAFAVAGDPGSAHLIWGGWRVDTTAAMAAILVGVLSLIAVAFWRIGLWIAEAPRRAERARVENRRRQTAEALSRGYLALAAGEGPEARRLA
ncbi:heme biosynthesis HemY N-terminal domain-containing protein, partial [Caulobacter sp. 17J65-9]|uniref:heme biosynthesis HemY N-terminal domain-containing protein n=1 Tax=Caulobacter sp. 17J65-9 TaxID=2709382 RepID=UPI0013C60907|nr:heme biosynthesis protein HemY [Caulobacter sp. 17J65-9]